MLFKNLKFLEEFKLDMIHWLIHI